MPCVKDLFCTNQILTTAGSKMLSNFVPSYESIVTQKHSIKVQLCLAKLIWMSLPWAHQINIALMGRLFKPMEQSM